MKPRYELIALAFACLCAPVALADPVGLQPLQVDPALMVPPPPKKAEQQAPIPAPVEPTPAAGQLAPPKGQPVTGVQPSAATQPAAPSPVPAAPAAPVSIEPASKLAPATGPSSVATVPAAQPAPAPLEAAPAAGQLAPPASQPGPIVPPPATTQPAAPSPVPSVPPAPASIEPSRQLAPPTGPSGAATMPAAPPAPTPSGEAERPPTAPAVTEEPSLRTSPALQPLQEPAGTPLPMFIEADSMNGVQDAYIDAEGKVKVRKHGQRVEADRLHWQQDTNELHAEGQVRLVQEGALVDGTSADLNLDTRHGHIEQPVYQLARPGGRGNATEITLEGEQHYTAKDATYTTCPVGVNDWLLQMDNLQIDNVRQVGTARNARLDFMGVPILYSPYVDFPLADQRKSGLLPPIFGSTQTTGIDITVPYYWNIAPNMDATIAPRFMSNRGIMLDGEYRYLFKDFNGILRGDYLDHDRDTGTDRWGLSVQHHQDLGYGFTGTVNFQRVSDNNFLRDFGNRIALTSLVTLPQDFYVTYSGGWWSALAQYETWQTLQDPLNPLTPPYNREPQLALNAAKQDVHGFDLGFTGEVVDFRNPLSTQVSGDRLLLYPTVSYPLLTPGTFVVPRASLHYTHYSFQGSSSDRPDADLTVPILSLDTGLIFERPWTLGGVNFVQTLEPRAFYVYAPFRDQSNLPVYDTAEADFNFAQLFLENRFVGGDRVNDANEITVALTSRLLDPANGDERLRMAIGQRFFFNSPRVTLGPTLPTTEPLTKSDFLAGLSAKIASQWLADSVWQYSPSAARTEKFSLGVRYQPEPGKVANLGYRYIFQQLEQVGGSVQWPIAGGLWALGMLDYSLQDNRTLNAVLGVEYNSVCWALRLVAQHFATSATDSTNQFFLQLELRGLAKLGSDPVEVLRQTIPGYQPIPAPSAPLARMLEY